MASSPIVFETWGRPDLPMARFFERYNGQTVVARHHHESAIPLVPSCISSPSRQWHALYHGQKTDGKTLFAELTHRSI